LNELNGRQVHLPFGNIHKNGLCNKKQLSLSESRQTGGRPSDYETTGITQNSIRFFNLEAMVQLEIVPICTTY
jgi:hypothetical protein